jgi:hypothetical protein
MITQLTREQAKTVYESKCWETWTDVKIVQFQLYQERLTIPFERFHQAIERILDRPVFTHEFAWPENIKAEFEGKKPKATFEDVMDLLKDKDVIIVEA